jgi:hypothetical protein
MGRIAIEFIFIFETSQQEAESVEDAAEEPRGPESGSISNVFKSKKKFRLVGKSIKAAAVTRASTS